MIGKHFGKWEVLKEVEKRNNKRAFECKCECGKTYVVYKRPLGNPFGKGVWKCYKCGYGGDYKDFRNNRAKFKKSQK